MSDQERRISVIVEDATVLRGGGSVREIIPVSKLAAEIRGFVADIGSILDSAGSTIARSARLAEVNVSASLEAGGKLSLLGTGVETKGSAGISFKFLLPERTKA